jgi:hypothetical protein
MTTINSTELISSLKESGFSVETSTFGEASEAVFYNLHLEISKPETKTVKAHVEIDNEGSVAEAYVVLLDENGEVYKNRDMIIFLEDEDCKGIGTLTGRLSQAMS